MFCSSEMPRLDCFTQCLQWDLFSDKYIGCGNQYKTGHVSSEAKNGKNKETSDV